MVSLSVSSMPTVPAPVPVSTVTTYELPLPLTLATDAPVTPLLAFTVKSLEVTPVTFSLKSTVKLTLVALDGSALLLVIDITTGLAKPPSVTAVLK